MAVDSARAGTRLGNLPPWVVFTVIGLVVAAVLVGTRIHSDRANDRRSDEVYCTLSGVGPYDRAPNTGKLCIDLH